MPKRDEGFFSAKDGTRLFWQSSWPDSAPKAAVGIVHGYGDHSERYRHVIDFLSAAGYEVMAFDYRGHGRADGAGGDVLKWSDYLDDLEAFWARFGTTVKSTKRFVLAHSHGALMSTHWLQRNPEGVTGVVLTGPYYRLAFDPPALQVFGAKLIRGVMPGLRISNGLKAVQLSRDEAWQKSTDADPLYGRKTTPRWFFQHLEWQGALAGTGKNVTQPLLMMAGSDDPIASVPAAKAYFDTIASADKTWKEWPGMRHEVLNEIGKEDVLATIEQWISKRS